MICSAQVVICLIQTYNKHIEDRINWKWWIWMRSNHTNGDSVLIKVRYQQQEFGRGGVWSSLGSCLSDLMPLAMATGFGGGAECSGRGLKHSCPYLCTHLLQLTNTHTHTNKTRCIYYILLSTSLFEMICSGCWTKCSVVSFDVFVCVHMRARERACDTVWAPDRPEEFRWVWTVSFFHTLFYTCTHTHTHTHTHTFTWPSEWEHTIDDFWYIKQIF